jgi:hypothetical protein
VQIENDRAMFRLKWNIWTSYDADIRCFTHRGAYRGRIHVALYRFDLTLDGRLRTQRGREVNDEERPTKGIGSNYVNLTVRNLPRWRAYGLGFAHWPASTILVISLHDRSYTLCHNSRAVIDHFLSRTKVA